MATARAMESDCSSDGEILEQSSVIEPYIDEPLAESGDELEENETDDEDGLSSATLVERYDKDVPVSTW